jgi:aryl-alcohol dehydrogenase-like predicted oxidoreductase
MNQPMNMFSVVGPHSAGKFAANIEAANINLTQQELDWLDLKIDHR